LEGCCCCSHLKRLQYWSFYQGKTQREKTPTW
jgi:hypothetical protein